MRFEVVCRLRDLEISTDYKRSIVSMKKSILGKEGREIFYGEHKKRGMTFSPFIKVEKIANNRIRLKDNELKIFISVEDIRDGWLLLNSFKKSKGKKYKFGDNEIEIIDVKSNKEEVIENEIAILKILSPIVIRENIDSKKEWYHELNEKGIDVLKANVRHQLRYDFPESELDRLEIQGLKTKKTVIHNYGIKYPATLGTIMLKGSSRVLNKIYRGGLGSKVSLGHGMLKLID